MEDSSEAQKEQAQNILALEARQVSEDRRVVWPATREQRAAEEIHDFQCMPPMMTRSTAGVHHTPGWTRVSEVRITASKGAPLQISVREDAEETNDEGEEFTMA